MTGAALGWLPWCWAGVDVSSDRCLPIARALTSSFKVLLSGEARNGYQASSVGLLRLQKLFELLEQGKIARGIFVLHLAEHGACTLKRAVARFGMSWTGSGGCHADEEALGAPAPEDG